MADAAPAAVTEQAPAAAEAETPAVEATPEPFVDPVEEAFGRMASEAKDELDGAETTAADPAAEPKPEGEPKPADPKVAAAALAAADEALFTDKALATPQGMKAAAARVRELKSEAVASLAKVEKHQRQVDRDFIVLKKRESKFAKGKEEHLAWYSARQNEVRMLGGHLDVIATSTEPRAVLDSLGFLMRKDGRDAYEMLVAGGAQLRKAPNPEIAELRAELRAEREERHRERAEAESQAERRRKYATIEQREAEILGAAKNGATYPTLARFVAERPREVLNEIVNMKRQHRQTYDATLTDAEAMLQLDQQLARLTGASGGAGQPRPEQGHKPGGQSDQSNPAREPSRVAGIPPSASTQVPAQREPTDDERRQELTPEFYQGIGLW